jgi:hypothetical protein
MAAQKKSKKFLRCLQRVAPSRPPSIFLTNRFRRLVEEKEAVREALFPSSKKSEKNQDWP